MNKDEITAHRVSSDDLVYAINPDTDTRCYSGKTLVCEILTDILDLALVAECNDKDAIKEKIEELHEMYRMQ